ncbi:hypothetical protein CSQ85_06510 [Bifidobacterium rousetti]|nr:hypothetical protein CSQ85_06510 [Bifidobacterium rousetti]
MVVRARSAVSAHVLEGTRSMNPKRNLSRAMAALAAAVTALTGMFAVGSAASAAQAAQGCVASKYAAGNFINITAPDVNQLLTSEKDSYGDARARTFRFVKIADYVFDANGTLTGFKSGHYDEGVVIGSDGKDSTGANRGMYSWDLAAWPLQLHNGKGDFAEGYVYDQSGEDPMQWMSEHLLSDSAKVRQFVDAIDETNFATKDENGKEIGRVSDYVTSGGIVHDPARQPYAAISRYNDGTGQLQYPLAEPGMYLAYDTSGEQKIGGATYSASKPLLIGTKLTQSPENCLPAVYGSTQIANTGTPEEKPKGSFSFYVKDDKGAVLEGAKFAISRTVDGVRKYGRIDNGKWVFDRDSVDALGENDIRVSGADGTVLFPFVESGDYTVEETSAPAGYGDALVTFDVTVNAFTVGAGTSLTYEATPGTGLTGEDNMHQDGKFDAKLTVVNAKAKSNKTALDEAVKKAEGLKEPEYTPDSWKTLQDALAKAKQVQADKDADQKAVDDAVKALNAAIDALEKPRMPVRFYVKDENGKGLAGAGFVVSKDGKYGRYADGKWVFDKANATDEGVTVESSKIDTSDNLGDAFTEFPDLETGDYTIEQVTAPKGYENPKVRFTVAFRAFPQDGGISMEYETTVDRGSEQYVTGKDYDNDGLIDHALSVRNDKTATPSVDKTKLDAAVKKAEGLKQSEYTSDSWKALQDALAKAKQVQADKDAGQKTVDDAVKALNDAIDGLRQLTGTLVFHTVDDATPSKALNGVGFIIAQKQADGSYKYGRITSSAWAFDKDSATDPAVSVRTSQDWPILNGDGTSATDPGRVQFNWLPAGEYRIEQVKAPEGYDNAGVRFDVTTSITAGGSFSFEAKAQQGSEGFLSGDDKDKDGSIDGNLTVRNDKAATPSVDKTKLDAAVKKAEGLKESEYTSDSWKALQDALAKAKGVQKDDKADQKAVDSAAKALNDAINALKKPTPSYPSGPSTPSQPVGLQVVYKPNKLEYRIGEQFDATVMVVRYRGSTLTPDQYTVALDTSKPGKVKVFITLNSDPTKATSFEVTVVISDVQVHRLYNPRSGEHFYVSSENEYNALIKSGQWRDEGIGFTMVDYGTPVYRLYNPGGKHLFTTSVKERDVLIGANWNYEGVAFYVPESSDGSGDSAVKVHRLYNPGNGDHLLTTSANERGVLVMHGWRDEGTAFTAR